MTPAETLREAAKLLRDTAAKATPGPWINADDALWIGGRMWGYAIPNNEGVFVLDDAPWIALAFPGLAEPLAAWLEGTAVAVEGGAIMPHSVLCAYALAVARAVLGQSATEEVQESWRCSRCGSSRWVGASLTGPVEFGGKAIKQCIPCGRYSNDPVEGGAR